MKAHTPGPWVELHDIDGDYAIYSEATVSKNKLIAVTESDGNVDLANACLIAAAPEMLEALEVLLDVTPFAADPLTQVIHAKAEAAIRKAKGE